MNFLNSELRNFDKKLDALLLRRKTRVQTSSVSVIKIIDDVKKNGDKALLKYEKKFNKNRVIQPRLNQINRIIKSLDPKVKKAIDTAYSRILKFHTLQKFKNISLCSKLFRQNAKLKHVSKKCTTNTGCACAKRARPPCYSEHVRLTIYRSY